LQLFPADLASKSFHLQIDRNGLKVDVRMQGDLLKVSKDVITNQKDTIFRVAIDKRYALSPPRGRLMEG
jgi:hypothetical protein